MASIPEQGNPSSLCIRLPATRKGSMEEAVAEQGERPADQVEADDDAGQASVVPQDVKEGGAAVNSGVDQQRPYEYSKRALPLEFMVLTAHCTRSYADDSVAFKTFLALLFVAFLADVLTVAQLINYVSLLPPAATVCISSASLVLMAYFLLLSLGRIYAYAILAVPLSLAAGFLGDVLRVGDAGEGGADNDADNKTLDHIFLVSAGVVTIIVGGGLTGTVFGHSISSAQPTALGAAGALGFLLFFTTVVGFHVMLITTVRAPVLTVHAKHLLRLLLLLLVTSTLVAAAESAGVLAFVAFSLDAIEVVSLALSSSAVDNDGDGNEARRKENQLLSTVVAAIIFTRIMQLHAAAFDGAAAAVRMLLYFTAFLCSLNWLLAGVYDAPARGVVRRALGWTRATVLVLAMLDVFYHLVSARGFLP